MFAGEVRAPLPSLVLAQVVAQVYVGIGILFLVEDGPLCVRALVEAGFEDRIMYGSEQQARPEWIYESVDAVES